VEVVISNITLLKPGIFVWFIGSCKLCVPLRQLLRGVVMLSAEIRETKRTYTEITGILSQYLKEGNMYIKHFVIHSSIQYSV
jgi:UPF0716 family protein affecting phage T7 exclusion